MKKENDEKRKLRGGYYTPEPIATFLVDWVLDELENPVVLEPSMGDGAFIPPFIEKIGLLNTPKVSFTGIELFSSEVKKAKNKITDRYKGNFNLISGNFFEEYKKLKPEYNVILGNPPFIRYQNIPKEYREEAMRILKQAGFKPNKLTNIWVFFLLASIKLLENKGKIAMVIPAELLQVTYAHEARKFISTYFDNVTIITFTKLVFDDVQQEVVLLLAEKNGKERTGIDVIEVHDVKDLQSLKKQIKKPEHFKPIDHNTDKWTQYFLEDKEIDLLKSILSNTKFTKLQELVDTDVGVVTGNNKFFVLTKETIDKYDLSEFVVKLVGRSKQLNGGVIFKENDWKEFENKGNPVYLLKLDNTPSNHSGLKAYLQKGIEDDVDKGYKCKIRKNWYSVPSIWIPQLLMLRQIHDFPRFIYNEAKAVPTDTIHRVKVFTPSMAKTVVTNFLNSMSFAFSEVVGRSYGGGVLELEPNEVNNIPIPYSDRVAFDLSEIDKMLRDEGIEKVLDYIDDKLLIEEFGLAKKDAESLRGIWKKLSQRRMNRK